MSYIPSPWFFEIVSCYAAQAGLILSILLPLPPVCWYTDIHHHACLDLVLNCLVLIQIQTQMESDFVALLSFATQDTKSWAPVAYAYNPI
jgi:hypothetical protein